MNQGIIKVSNEFWKQKRLRRLLKRNFKIIATQEDFCLNMKIIKCESQYFLKQIKEGYKLPEYEVHMKEVEMKFLFFKWKKIRIVEVKLFVIKELNDIRYLKVDPIKL